MSENFKNLPTALDLSCNWELLNFMPKHTFITKNLADN